jgi:hypothetical protein
MRAVLILPFAGSIFLAGYITARYSIVNRVIDSASLFIVELCNILFHVLLPNPLPPANRAVLPGSRGIGIVVVISVDSCSSREDC